MHVRVAGKSCVEHDALILEQHPLDQRGVPILFAVVERQLGHSTRERGRALDQVVKLEDESGMLCWPILMPFRVRRRIWSA